MQPLCRNGNRKQAGPNTLRKEALLHLVNDITTTGLKWQTLEDATRSARPVPTLAACRAGKNDPSTATAHPLSLRSCRLGWGLGMRVYIEVKEEARTRLKEVKLR